MYVETDPVYDKFALRMFVDFFRRVLRSNREQAIQIVEALASIVNEDE